MKTAYTVSKDVISIFSSTVQTENRDKKSTLKSSNIKPICQYLLSTYAKNHRLRWLVGKSIYLIR